MVKCEGCPIAKRFYPCDGKAPYPAGHVDCHIQDCHLTPADFPIIRAMIAEEWNCSKCGHADLGYGPHRPGCKMRGGEVSNLYPCEMWQPRKGVEDK